MHYNKLYRKSTIAYHALIISFFLLVSCQQQESISTVIERGLTTATEQSLLMAKALELQEDKLPRTFENDKLRTTTYSGWVSGFFPGVLWYLYENTSNDTLKNYAEIYTARVEPAKYVTSHHDLGFMLYCSFGNGYRLTHNPEYLEVMKTGAESLASRYNDQVQAIQSWNKRGAWEFPVIIDNMMNLEFLIFMSRATGDDTYLKMAESHANTTLKNHFRDDYSSYHVVSYDPQTGQAVLKQTHQGYADESAWARGQAWALYGYTMMYRETQKLEYLELARNVGSFIITHPHLPKDKIPYWDFNDPKIPDTYRDASAAAIMASAFVELSRLDTSADASNWLSFAEEQIRSLSSADYLAEVGTNGNFILKHSVGNLNKNSEVDVPLSYADYYYVEALMRLKQVLKM